MSKLSTSLKPLALAQNKIQPKHMAGFWNGIFPDASDTNSEFVSTFSGRQWELLWKI